MARYPLQQRTSHCAETRSPAGSAVFQTDDRGEVQLRYTGEESGVQPEHDIALAKRRKSNATAICRNLQRGRINSAGS